MDGFGIQRCIRNVHGGSETSHQRGLSFKICIGEIAYTYAKHLGLHKKYSVTYLGGSGASGVDDRMTIQVNPAAHNPDTKMRTLNTLKAMKE